MRIAFVTETFLPKIDGIVNTLCHLLDYLALKGHQSILFAPHGGPQQYANTPIIGRPAWRFPLYPELNLVPPINTGIEKVFADFKPDVVHLVNPAVFGLAGLKAAKKRRIPIVASYHTDIPGFARRWGFSFIAKPLWDYFTWIHNQADLNLCPSQATRTELQEHGIKNVKLWKRGVNTNQYHPSHRSQEHRSRLTRGNETAPLLLYVGRLSMEKRVDWLLPVIRSIPEARLAIVGDGPMRMALESMFAGTNTVFTGYLSGNELAKAYASADIFVFPAANETFGNVILEAMASNLPVIAPDTGGVTDLICDGINGLLFPAEQKSALINRVRELVQDRSRARQMGTNGRAFAETQSWSSIFDRLLHNYSLLVRQHSMRLNKIPKNKRGFLTLPE
ncbi:MAG: glycosyltransferase family 1 protein [Anaerolineae bacterium]|nr:glycosyltransferase family 1 protein [Anaerolineae bacterium]